MEPVHLFQNFNGYNPLKLFYENPQKYAFFLQNHIIEAQCDHFVQHVLKCSTSVDILLCERTLFSPKVFTKVLYRSGCLTMMEMDKLLQCSDKTLAKYCPACPLGADYLFYLEETPQVCQQRIRSRGREGEESITGDYLKLVEDEYKQYVTDFVKLKGDLCLRSAPGDMSRVKREEALLNFIDDIRKEKCLMKN